MLFIHASLTIRWHLRECVIVHSCLGNPHAPSDVGGLGGNYRSQPHWQGSACQLKIRRGCQVQGSTYKEVCTSMLVSWREAHPWDGQGNGVHKMLVPCLGIFKPASSRYCTGHQAFDALWICMPFSSLAGQGCILWWFAGMQSALTMFWDSNTGFGVLLRTI